MEQIEEEKEAGGNEPAGSKVPGSAEGFTAHGDERRRKLVEAAYSIVAEKGLEGLRTRDIAARAEVNIATLHYYFNSKEQLIRAVFANLHDEFVTYKAPDYADATDALGQLRGFLLSTPYRLQTRPQMYVVLSELLSRGQRDPLVRDILKDMNIHWQGLIQEVLNAGISQGVFRADLDAQLVSRMITGMLSGLITHWQMNPGSVDFEKIAAELENWLRVK